MFDPAVRAIEPELIAWRRHLHQHPEVSFEETQTTLWLLARLREIGGIETHLVVSAAGVLNAHQEVGL